MYRALLTRNILASAVAQKAGCVKMDTARSAIYLSAKWG